MKQRGRISAQSAEIASLTGPIETVPRIRPPHDLNDEEVEVWASVTSSVAADWFTPATVPMLAQYCRHSVAAKRIAELIERATSDQHLEIQDYNRLLGMQERESRALTTIGTKLRITPQSLINQRGNKHKAAVKKPWEG